MPIIVPTTDPTRGGTTLNKPKGNGGSHGSGSGGDHGGGGKGRNEAPKDKEKQDKYCTRTKRILYRFMTL